MCTIFGSQCDENIVNTWYMFEQEEGSLIRASESKIALFFQPVNQVIIGARYDVTDEMIDQFNISVCI